MGWPLPALTSRRHIGSSIGTWFALAVVLVVDAAFLLNNLVPYLGLNYAGAKTMYSGLAPGGANHDVLRRDVDRSE
jgi:hypothetical protein